jgi:hypothetical protein
MPSTVALVRGGEDGLVRSQHGCLAGEPGTALGRRRPTGGLGDASDARRLGLCLSRDEMGSGHLLRDVMHV